MARSKRSVPGLDAPPTTTPQEYGGGSPTKKKKKRRKQSQEEEEEATASSLLSQSFSSQSSLGLSPSKKKKKKRRKGEEEESDVITNGIMEEEEEEGKKKKKRKKVMAVKQEQRNEEEEEEGASKKKKKKKKEEEENKKMKIIKKEKEEEEASTKSSPRKKGKKKEKASPSRPAAAAAAAFNTTFNTTKEEVKMDVDDEEINMNIEEEEEGEAAWPEEATMQLLSQVTRQLPAPLRDTRSGRVSLKGMDWGRAAIPDRSPDACQQHFMALYKKINPFKNLTTMVDEMGRLVMSGLGDRRNRPPLPIHRFLKLYFTPEMKAEAKRNGENMFKLGHRAWKELPADQKQVYIQCYKDDCAKMKPSQRQKPEPAVQLPRMPYQLCWKVERQEGSAIRSRSYYASLPPEKQLPYIREALQQTIQYEDDLTTHLASNPEYEPPPCHVPKNDLKTYLDALGCPATPPLRPALLFYKEAVARGKLKGVPGMRKVSEAMLIYKELSLQEKNKYKERSEEELMTYEADLKEWSKEQDEVTLFALKKYRDVVPYTRNLVRELAARQKKTHHVKADDIFPHKAPAVTSCPKFLSEPPRPPTAAYRLFTAKFRTTIESKLTGAEMQRALRNGWKALNDTERLVYIRRCHSLHKQYETDVKSYVSELDAKTRRLFLGFNRVPLFRFFGNRDIFSETFPNSDQYPVLVKGLPDTHTHTHASPTKYLEDSDEDDLVQAAQSTQKKKLAPVVFSSLKDTPSPTSPSLKKSKTPPAAPPPPLSDEESSSDEEEEVAPTWHSPVLISTTTAKKKAAAPPATTTTTTRKKGGKVVPPPQPQTPPQESDESEEEEEEVTPAWRSRPPAATGSPMAWLGKRTAEVHAAAWKKSKVTRAPPPQESEDEEEGEEVTPAWRSSPPKPASGALPRHRQDSSSSGFSDTDSSDSKVSSIKLPPPSIKPPPPITRSRKVRR